MIIKSPLLDEHTTTLDPKPSLPAETRAPSLVPAGAATRERRSGLVPRVRDDTPSHWSPAETRARRSCGATPAASTPRAT
jgi:hypothetical protein